jgi:hypothetical protein
MYEADGNVYECSGLSGVVTGVAANGVVLAFRNPSSAVIELLSLDLFVRTIAGFTAAQELAVAASFVFSFASANYTGGTNLSDPSGGTAGYYNVDIPIVSSPSWTGGGASQLTSGNISIANTAALTHAGSPTFMAQPFAWDGYGELAAAATVGKGFLEAKYRASPRGGQRLGLDSGFVARLPIAMAAGGTARLYAHVVWREFG